VSHAPIVPGATLGVLGSGQLGRMFAMAARRMGYRVHVLSPESDTPAGQIADVEVRAAYDDLDQVSRFARGVDVVTFEFENVPAPTAEAAARFAPVRPAGRVLHTAQQRAREKAFLRGHGFPVTPFARVTTDDELVDAVETVGLPAVLKTAQFGYDGKGQAKVTTRDEAASAWQSMRRQEAVLERFITFEREVSVVAARGLDGWVASYGVIENAHANHILDVSVMPAAVTPATERRAAEIARGILETLDVVGVLCVEFFVTGDGELLINELAPRPHNSGHLTIDACMTSQFELQVRAVCGLPAGSVEQLRPAAMANLLGDVWSRGEPDWAAACALPGVHLHLYGKTEPRPGRKMGHLTALAATAGEARDLAVRARSALIPRQA
jgi:5-(carboxyamino)imidazole ribonucleotide synthase